MSYKQQVLSRIMDELAQLYLANDIDNLRVEVMRGNNRHVLVSDSTMLTVPEMGHLVSAKSKPELKVV